MVKTLNKKGFAAIIPAAIILAIAVTSFVSYKVYFKEKLRKPDQVQENSDNFLFDAKTKEDMKRLTDIDLDNPPKFIQADFIKLDTITRISRFRSGAGHAFPYPDGESCRSMKHYFMPQQTAESVRINYRDNPPEFNLENAIPIYSPVDGEIAEINKEQTPIGEQIYIKPTSYPNVRIRLFHIYKLDGVNVGKKVSAGEQIGNIGQYQGTDIAIQINSGQFSEKRDYVSYFSVMADDIFAKYQARGVKSRDDFIISKEYRDTHPLKCNGEMFAENYDVDKETYFNLSGYSDVRRQ